MHILKGEGREFSQDRSPVQAATFTNTYLMTGIVNNSGNFFVMVTLRKSFLRNKDLQNIWKCQSLTKSHTF